MSRSWMFDPDTFLIQKGWGVYDIDQVIEAFCNGQGAAVQDLMQLGHHNVRESELSGVEIDAIDMAIRNALISNEVYEVLHNGPTDPQFQNAAKLAIQAGAPIINTAIQQQNNINMGRGIAPMPMAFQSDRSGSVQVNVPWVHGASAEPAHILLPGTKNANPFNPNNQLVTHITSTNTKREEGWARPYEESLQAAGREETKRNDRYIRGHKDVSNRNLVSFNDNNQAIQMNTAVRQHFQEALGQGLDRTSALAHAKEMWMQDNRAFHMTGHHHHAQESTYGRVIRPDDGEQPFSDAELEHEMQMLQGTDPEVTQSPQTNPAAVIHPDHRDTTWMKNMVSNQRHSFFDKDSGIPNQKVVSYLTEHHHMDDAQAAQFIEDVSRKQNGTPTSGSIKNRFTEALLNHHVTQTSAVPTWYDDAPPPNIAEALNPSQAVVQPPTLQPEPIVVHTAPPPEAPTPPVAPIARPEANTAPPLVSSPMPTLNHHHGINTNKPLTDADEQGLGGEGIMDQIATILGRIAGNRTILRSEDANHIEDYLENVQLELAKAVIEDTYDVPTFDINSATDIAMMGAHIQRPTADVISILFTKGDWRNVAKTLGIDHEKVQMVKVAFS